MNEPITKEPASRGGRAMVEQRKKRRRFLAGQCRRDLEVAPCRGIECDEFARCLDEHFADVRKGCLLSRAGIREQRTRRRYRERNVLSAERRQIARAELLRQRTFGGRLIENRMSSR